MNSEEDQSGKVVKKNGSSLNFDDWYRLRFGEDPSQENLKKRLSATRLKETLDQQGFVKAFEGS